MGVGNKDVLAANRDVVLFAPCGVTLVFLQIVIGIIAGVLKYKKYEFLLCLIVLPGVNGFLILLFALAFNQTRQML